MELSGLAMAARALDASRRGKAVVSWGDVILRDYRLQRVPSRIGCENSPPSAVLLAGPRLRLGTMRGATGGEAVTIRRPADESRQRERAIRAARTTSELEGARSTAATRADQDAYVRGEIDISQLGQRVRARYNLA